MLYLNFVTNNKGLGEKEMELSYSYCKKKHIYSVRFGEIRDSVIILDSGSRFGSGHLQISDSDSGFAIRVS